MGDLLIRNISDALKRDIAAAADRTGRSLSDEAKELLRKGLITESDIQPVEESAYDVLRTAIADDLMTDEEHAEFMAGIEEGRKSDLARPGFEFE
jgi:plasmid stability protein